MFVSLCAKNCIHFHSCGNSVHIKCMKVWADHQKSSGETQLKCPLCRENFCTFERLNEGTCAYDVERQIDKLVTSMYVRVPQQQWHQTRQSSEHSLRLHVPRLPRCTPSRQLLQMHHVRRNVSLPAVLQHRFSQNAYVPLQTSNSLAYYHFNPT
jgi:hypothetical protein